MKKRPKMPMRGDMPHMKDMSKHMKQMMGKKHK